MEIKRSLKYCLVFAVCVSFLAGCGKRDDESKPISEVKEEADQMTAEQLKSMAAKYKEAILAKNDEVEKVLAKLKDIPVTEMLGQEAKDIKADVDNLKSSVSALKERFEVYYDKLKEKGGDTSGLEL